MLQAGIALAHQLGVEGAVVVEDGRHVFLGQHHRARHHIGLVLLRQRHHRGDEAGAVQGAEGGGLVQRHAQLVAHGGAAAPVDAQLVQVALVQVYDPQRQLDVALGHVERLRQVLDEAHLFGGALDQQAIGVRVGDHLDVAGRRVLLQRLRQAEASVVGRRLELAAGGKVRHRRDIAIARRRPRRIGAGGLQGLVLALQQLLNHRGHAGDDDLLVTQLIAAVADKGIVEPHHAYLLPAQLDAVALLVHEAGGVDHQVDEHRRAGHVERAAAVVAAQRITLVVEAGLAQEVVEGGERDIAQRHHRIAGFAGVVDIDGLAVVIPDQAQLLGHLVQQRLRIGQVEIAADLLARRLLADNHRLFQPRGNRVEERAQAFLLGDVAGIGGARRLRRCGGRHRGGQRRRQQRGG